LPKVAYICACYYGPRRRPLWDNELPEPWESEDLNDSLIDLKKQIKTVSEFSESISTVIFVCNLRSRSVRDRKVHKKAEELVRRKNEEDADREWKIVKRVNDATLSYGSWEHGLQKLCPEDTAYAFVTEDDFIPGFKGFDTEVIERYFTSKLNRKKAVFCASLWVDGKTEYEFIANTEPHAAVSTGVFNMRLFRKVGSLRIKYRGQPALRKGDDVVKGRYRGAGVLQMRFLNHFINRWDMQVIDASADYSCPFIVWVKEDEKLYKKYLGKKGGKPIFIPTDWGKINES